MAALRHDESTHPLQKDDIVVFAENTRISRVGGDLTIVEGQPDPDKMAAVREFIEANRQPSRIPGPDPSQIAELEKAVRATYENCIISEVRGNQYEFKATGEVASPQRTDTYDPSPTNSPSSTSPHKHKQRVYRGSKLSKVDGDRIIIKE